MGPSRVSAPPPPTTTHTTTTHTMPPTHIAGARGVVAQRPRHGQGDRLQRHQSQRLLRLLPGGARPAVREQEQWDKPGGGTFPEFDGSPARTEGPHAGASYVQTGKRDRIDRGFICTHQGPAWGCIVRADEQAGVKSTATRHSWLAERLMKGTTGGSRRCVITLPTR